MFWQLRTRVLCALVALARPHGAQRPICMPSRPFMHSCIEDWRVTFQPKGVRIGRMCGWVTAVVAW